MLMLRASLQKPSPTDQSLLQKRPTGVAQRSGAKSGAKRLDPSSDHNATACKSTHSNSLLSKNSFPSYPIPATKFREYPFRLPVVPVESENQRRSPGRQI